MLAEEPHLQFIGAQNVADYQVVRSLITQFIGALSQSAAVTDDDLMGLKQTGDLHRDFFASLGGSLNPSSLGDIIRHRDTYPAQYLNAFCNRVHKLNLFVVVLIE